MDASWTFCVDGSRVTWDWANGAPPVERLEPVRSPASGTRSRHVPATAYSTTTRGWLQLESGLEHDLVRILDRRSDVRWIVAQPALLTFVGDRGKHLPDVLSVGATNVTVWDCRPPEGQDEEFARDTAATATACAEVGWAYEVFAGQVVTARLNERWLAGFRRPRPWHDRHREIVLGRCATESTLGEMLSRDDGSGEITATVWHLLWTGDLTCDLDSRLTSATTIRRGECA